VADAGGAVSRFGIARRSVIGAQHLRSPGLPAIPGSQGRHSCLRGFTRHRVTFVRPAYAASTSHRVT
jgi:hypothetical protein